MNELTPIERLKGKANAELYRGSARWPDQTTPTPLEPPLEDYNREQITLWDKYHNDWGKPNLTLNPPPWVNDFRQLSAIQIERFSEDATTIQHAEQLLRSLPALSRPAAFEVTAFGGCSEGKIVHRKYQPAATVIQFVVHQNDAPILEHQLTANYPNSAIILHPQLTKQDMALSHSLNEVGGYGVTLSLASTFIEPLNTFANLKQDPLGVAIAALDHIPERLWAAIQILFMPVRHNWKRTVTAAVENPYLKGGDFIFSDVNAQMLTTKFASPLFTVSIRLVSQEEHTLNELQGWAEQFSNPPQAFDYIRDIHETMPNALGSRQAFSPGMILNTEELAALVHLPSNDVLGERLQRITTRTRAAPEHQKEPHSVNIGTNTHRGHTTKARIPANMRSRHCYITGASGMGKSTLLLHMIKQDIEAGHGVGVIDPHGDLIDDVLKHIPQARIDDVALFDPADLNYPPAFNILACKNQPERERLVSEVVTTLHSFFGDSWGVKLEHYLKHALMTLLRFKNATLPDIPLILNDANFRRKHVSQLPPTDTILRSFWNTEFAHPAKQSLDAINNKLTPFLLFDTVRNIICQRQAKFDFDDIINQQKILLVRLPAGLLSEEMVTVFGTFIMSKLIGATFRRADPDKFPTKASRLPFYLYLDEFQNFVNLAVSFERVLSEARKYNLSLTLANQFIGQLPPDIKQAIFGNVGSLISFKVGVLDSKIMAQEMGQYTHDEVTALDVGQAIARIGGSETAFNLATKLIKEPKQHYTNQIRQHSRQKHCTPISQLQATQPATTTPPTTNHEVQSEQPTQEGLPVRHKATTKKTGKPTSQSPPPDNAKPPKPAPPKQEPPPEQVPERQTGRDIPDDDFV